jgi:hypothetical protein
MRWRPSSTQSGTLCSTWTRRKGAATRKRIYGMAADERLLVIGYHTSFPSLGFVQRAEPAYRWLPLTYQLAV